MSDPNPPHLDYEPPKGHEVAAVFTFIGCAILWTVLAPVLGFFGVLSAQSFSNKGVGYLVIGAGIMLMIGALLWSATKIRRPAVRTATICGTLCGLAVGGLLFGWCFAAMKEI